MKRKRVKKAEIFSDTLFFLGVSLLGIWGIVIFAVVGMIIFVPNFDGLNPQSNVSAFWLALIPIGIFFFAIGGYFKFIHQRLPLSIQPFGLLLPILATLYFLHSFTAPEIQEFAPIFSEVQNFIIKQQTDISIELLGGVFTAWIFYYGFEISREEEQEQDHKQLLSELKSIRKELAILKQVTSNQNQAIKPTPSFFARLFSRK